MATDTQARTDIKRMKDDITALQKGIAVVRDRLAKLEAISSGLDENMDQVAAELNGIKARLDALEEDPGEDPSPTPAPPEKPGVAWGVDISDWQGPDVNFAQLKKEGYSFFFTKASQGTYWRSKYCQGNITRGKNAGLIPGVYHFLEGTERPGGTPDAKEQVDNLQAVIGNAEGLMVAVDVESALGSPSPQKKHLWAFLQELSKRLGKHNTFVVYSGDWYYLPNMGNPQFSELEDEGINVVVWSTPNEGYARGFGLLSVLYEQIDKSNWEQGQGFGGKPTKILQVSDKVVTQTVNPVDGNVCREGVEFLKTLRVKAEPEADNRPPILKVKEYGTGIIGTPYEIDEGDIVKSENPAWAENAPPPPIPYVKARTCYCAGVPNLLHRVLGLTIPYRPSIAADIREKYDGGTWSYQDYFEGVLEPFSLTQPDGSPWPPLTLFVRRFTAINLGSQGHVALQWFNAKLLQSYIARADGWPGVNAGITLEDSHNGWYYEYVVRPENIWSQDLLDQLKTPLLTASFKEQVDKAVSEPHMVEAFRSYQHFTETGKKTLGL